MFLPDSTHGDDKEERKAECTRVEKLSLEFVPEEIRGEVQISVQEVQCGDPNCAPIDTAITLVFNRQVLLLNYICLLLCIENTGIKCKLIGNLSEKKIWTPSDVIVATRLIPTRF